MDNFFREKALKAGRSSISRNNPSVNGKTPMLLHATKNKTDKHTKTNPVVDRREELVRLSLGLKLSLPRLWQESLGKVTGMTGASWKAVQDCSVQMLGALTQGPLHLRIAGKSPRRLQSCTVREGSWSRQEAEGLTGGTGLIKRLITVFLPTARTTKF